MQPAFSVLVFTVASGAGYGLLLWMVFFQLIAGSVLVDELLYSSVLGIALVTVGLLSSTLHLANPKNAWRAFNRFRTSWLSREGVFALLFYPLILGYALLLWFNDGKVTTAITVLGIAVIMTALTTVACTGMIYASLKPIRQWHNPFTLPLYILFSLLSGLLLLIVVRHEVHNAVVSGLSACFIAVALLAAACKWRYFTTIGQADGVSIGAATGFTQAHVRLLDAGHSSGTFLTDEFIYNADAQRLHKLRAVMLSLTFALPIACVAIFWIWQPAWPLYFALISLFAGLLLERWLFFAEARHAVRLYHGDQRA